jgi:hypothetical protein
MKKGILTLLAMAVVGATVFTARAIPVTGGISFTGSATIDSSSLSNATAFTGISAVVLGGSQTGSYASVDPGTVTTWTPFTFSVSSVTPLWTFTVGSIVYSFDATTVTVVTQDSMFLNIVGEGLARITGMDDTVGTWSITATGGTSTFIFGAESVTPPESPGVPDSGVTAILLGMALSGLALLRKGVRNMEELA